LKNSRFQSLCICLCQSTLRRDGGQLCNHASEADCHIQTHKLWEYNVMKLEIEINNKSKSPLTKAFLNGIVQKTLLEVDWDFLPKKTISLSLAFVGKAEMQAINKKYRKVDAVTDILSFAEYKDKKEMKKSKEEELFLGELILCYDDIKEYAKGEKLNLKEESIRVVSHGVLHLLGMSHGKKMFAIQDRIPHLFCAWPLANFARRASTKKVRDKVAKK
jgi:probable rRNA maturation factor